MAKLALLSCGATDIRNHGSPSRLNITWLNRCDATDVGGVGHSGNFRHQPPVDAAQASNQRSWRKSNNPDLRMPRRASVMTERSCAMEQQTGGCTRFARTAIMSWDRFCFAKSRNSDLLE